MTAVVFVQSWGVQLFAAGRHPRAPRSYSPARPPWRPTALQLLLLTSVPSELSQVAGCSQPSWEQAETAALDKIQTAGPGQ